MIFDNLIPFGLIDHSYNFTFELNPHFYIDENIFNKTTKLVNEEIEANNKMNIIIPMIF